MYHIASYKRLGVYFLAASYDPFVLDVYLMTGVY